MAYIEPSEFSTKLVDSGEQKVYMSTKDTLIRAFMAGAILGLAAVFAIENPRCAAYPFSAYTEPRVYLLWVPMSDRRFPDVYYR